MTSRHAALLHCVTGALCKMDCDPDKRECEGFSEQGYVKLKRENDLAQTEIKEHMRVEDELKAELAEARKYWSLYFDECVSADVRLLIAQARIAELEKVLVCAHALCDEFSWSLGMDDSNPMKGTGNRLADAVAALKSRA